jgi:hypothetical protein
MRIECRYGLTPTFYPGRIDSIAEHGSYDVVYDDGDREVNVSRRRLRVADQRQRLDLQPGDSVDARADDGKVRPGSISAKRTDVCTIDGEDVATTLYEVAFADGDVSEHLERHFIFGDFHDGPTPRATPAPTPGPTPVPTPRPTSDPASSAIDATPRLAVGTPVTARFRGSPSMYPGKISCVNEDGTYDVAYDDGGAEAAVVSSFIEATLAADAAEAEATEAGESFRAGDAVEADFRGQGRFYAGKNSAARADGSYDVAYEDGDAEAGVAPASVRRRSATEAPVQTTGDGVTLAGFADAKRSTPIVQRTATTPQRPAPAFAVGDLVDAGYPSPRPSARPLHHKKIYRAGTAAQQKLTPAPSSRCTRTRPTTCSTRTGSAKQASPRR